MKTPTKYDIELKKGCDYLQMFRFIQEDESPMDLTGWSAKSQIRVAKRRTSDLVAEFTISIPTPANGEMYLKLTDSQTGEMEPEVAYYDILLTSPEEFDEIYVEGIVCIGPTVTLKE